MTELTRIIKTAKGNTIELVGAEKHGKEWLYMIKVNGKHVKELYSETQLKQMMA